MRINKTEMLKTEVTSMGLFIGLVILNIIAFVGIAWSHCPKGIIRTLIEQERLKRK